MPIANAVNASSAPPWNVANGGTGLATLTTAYSVLCAGTTATGNVQPLAALGAAGTVLTSNGAGALPSFQAVGGGGSGTGSIKQVQTTSLITTFTTNSTSYTDLTGLSVAITPSAATSKILILFSSNASCSGSGVAFQIVRGATPIGIGTGAGARTTSTSAVPASAFGTDQVVASMNFIDNPATTSATTYKIQISVPNGSAFINEGSTDANASSSQRTISTITVMEIL